MERAIWSDLGNGRKVGFRYFGVGDIGGAPDAESVEWLREGHGQREAGRSRSGTPPADQLARDLTDAERAALPDYEGELLLKTHGVGCYTSQAAMKRWNRRNELLADAAERASVAADWLGGPAYPRERLRTAWIRFLWHQFHDDLTGTSIPQAYQFSWNDELLSLNEFAERHHRRGRRSSRAASTRGDRRARRGLQPARDRRAATRSRRTVQFGRAAPAAVRVVDTASGERGARRRSLSSDGVSTTRPVLAEMPSVGFTVFDVQAPGGAASPQPAASSRSTAPLRSRTSATP